MKNDLINEYREVKDKFEKKKLLSRILYEFRVNKHIIYTSNPFLRYKIYKMIEIYFYDLRKKRSRNVKKL